MKYILVKHIKDAVKQYDKDISAFRVSINPIIKELKNIINGMEEHEFLEAVDVFRGFVGNDLKIKSASFSVFKNLLIKTGLVPDVLLARKSVDNELYDFYIYLKHPNYQAFNKESFDENLGKLYTDYYKDKEAGFLKETLFGIMPDSQININQSLLMQFIKLKIFFNHIENHSGKALSLVEAKSIFKKLDIDLSSSAYPESMFRESNLWENAPVAYSRFILSLGDLTPVHVVFDRDNIEGFLENILKMPSCSSAYGLRGVLYSGVGGSQLAGCGNWHLGVIDLIIGGFKEYDKLDIFDSSNFQDSEFLKLITESRADIDIKLLLLKLLIKSNFTSNSCWEQSFISRCIAIHASDQNWEFKLVCQILSPRYSTYYTKKDLVWEYCTLHDFFLDALDEGSNDFKNNNILMEMWHDFYRSKGESLKLDASYLDQFNQLSHFIGEPFKYDDKLRLTELKLRNPIDNLFH